MRRYDSGPNIADFDAVRLTIASSEDIMDWSHGEVLKPETINYRTQKPERDGLFCERIFGPAKDLTQHDAKLKGIRSREVAVDKKGEIVTKTIVRRERMGHIALAAPVSHIWFLRGTPSPIGLVLNMTVKNLERIAYFASYVFLKVDAEKRDLMLADKEAEFEAGKVAIKARFEKKAKDEKADVKALAEAQTKEIEELTETYEETKTQLTSLVLHALVPETDFRNMPEEMQDLVEVGMGGSAIKAMLDTVDLGKLIEDLNKEAIEAKGQRKKKIMKRLRMLENMHRSGIKPNSMCVTVLPVIPPDLRPMVQLTGGRFATSDLNDLYRRVINRNNRLKKLVDLNAPEIIRRNEQRMLQEAVDALIDNSSARSGRAVSTTGQRRRLKSLSDMLKGKQGRFRQNLLGKRVDYSGRSVIVAGPELNIHQCGLPKMMALELFKPFVIGLLIEQEVAQNIRAATRMIELGEIVVWDALDEVIKGKYVLLNRAPSLHRLSIQAFQPKLIEGKAIQLHPLVCKGFNADFDGDQMAVHLPLSDAAQAEARDLMSASHNILKPADGTPVLHIEQDIVLGAYYITYDRYPDKKRRNFSSVDEAFFAYESGKLLIQDPIRVSFRDQVLETSLGRVLFNEIFPEEFPFQNEAMTKKKLQKVMALVYQTLGQEKTAEVADELKNLAFYYATLSGLSMGMDDFVAIDGFEGVVKEGEKKAALISGQYDQGFITNEERARLTIDTWEATDATVQQMLNTQMETIDNSISISVTSGARGSLSEIKNTVGMLGILSDAAGREIELPVKNGFKHGLSTLEYFTGARGTRKSLVDIALRTADSGYLTRRLVDVSQDVFTVEGEDNDPGYTMHKVDAAELGITLGTRLLGRYLAETLKIEGKMIARRGDLITTDIAGKIDLAELETVKIMSVLSTSLVRGIPRKSYGLDPANGQLVVSDHPIGVIAAQSIGEPGTQLSLDSKHRISVVEDRSASGLTRIEELFEARTPKGQAYLTDIAGKVKIWEEGDNYVVQVTGKDQKQTVLEIGGRVPQVKAGTEVSIGDVVASGDGGDNPLITPVSGTIEVSAKEIIVTPHETASVKYEIPGFKQLMVKDGDVVGQGDRLTSGSINLQELMRLKGVEETQRYIVNEISRIFATQGQLISDKHLEIVIRQMFSRVQVEDAGDSQFVIGDIASRAAIVEENTRLIEAKQEPVVYTQLLLGITKVSIWSDSFLSAASFQDTTRVLISAATSGKLDKLYGLKENVILGRKIPVGTGVLKADTVTDVAEEG